MIVLSAAPDDPVRRAGIRHFFTTAGIAVRAPGSDPGAVAIGYGMPPTDAPVRIRIAHAPSGDAVPGELSGEGWRLPFSGALNPVSEGGETLAWVSTKDGRRPCIVGDGTTITVAFDLFAETGAWLCGRRDRPLAGPGGDPAAPVVDGFEALLVSCIRRACHLQGIPFVATAHWPHTHTSAVCLTHDVDELAKTYQWVTRPLRYARRGDGPGLLRQFRSLVAKIGGKEPYWTFDAIRRMDDELQIRSTFYFLEESMPPRLQDPSTWNVLGRCRSLNQPAARALIRDLAHEGHEIGVHGSYRSYADGDLLSREKARIEEITGLPVTGIRQHHLNLAIPGTWELQAKAGFTYDTSLGYKDRPGFRGGTCFPLHPETASGPLSLLELPLAVMDITVPEGPAGWEACRTISDRVAAAGGLLMLLWHPPVFNPLEMPDAGDLCPRLIRHALARGAWTATAGDIAAWWRHRCSAPVSWTARDGILRLSFSPGGEGVAIDIRLPRGCTATIPEGARVITREGQHLRIGLSPGTGLPTTLEMGYTCS
ncbi:MAG: polysaccharide deacetylase family protein [Methanomicrobiaceae archaeon]|nr:polysaccharide deacetylase family protein [Methanomicrobiaceae archaeon]